MQAFSIVVQNFQFRQASPISFIGKVVKDGLTGVLFGPTQILSGPLWVVFGQFGKFLCCRTVPVAEVPAWVLQEVLAVRHVAHLLHGHEPAAVNSVCNGSVVTNF